MTDSEFPIIKEGFAHIYYAFDVGQTIDLNQAEQKIKALKERTNIQNKRRAPKYFDFKPRPIQAGLKARPVQIGNFQTQESVNAVLYDFGAVSVSFKIPLQGSLDQLIGLSEKIYDDSELQALALQLTTDLVKEINGAINKPLVSELFEVYTVFEIKQYDSIYDLTQFSESYGAEIAQILRAETGSLSPQEVEDALSHRISYDVKDVSFIDWNASLVFDEKAEDTIAVLEFNNVQLLELRYLDDQMDGALDRSYDRLNRGSKWIHPIFKRHSTSDLRQVSEYQVDAVLLFEGVNNALKLTGDPFLARVYRLASQRFHLGRYEKSIQRKLDIVDSIFNKMSDIRANQRMEVLEWIIIILIAVSILIPFIPGIDY